MQRGPTLLICLTLGLLAGCGSTSSSSGSGGSSGGGSAADYLASKTGEDAVALQQAMDDLAPSCTGPEDDLAGLAYAGVSDLNDHGISSTALEVMAQVKNSVPASAAPIDCQGVLAAWLVLRENG
ncbi:MAG TPA: hypothetical protein VGO31_08915 [Microbacteriaceae bacterium]|nr:hypothetical protein [Microbacteriaceae bacterium]